MLEFENKVDKYVDDTGNHVLYRVTPVFEGDDLVASGVHMEAWSVEDDGDGICFNVYCYNVQPGIGIDYIGKKAFAGDKEIEDMCLLYQGLKILFKKIHVKKIMRHRDWLSHRKLIMRSGMIITCHGAVFFYI